MLVLKDACIFPPKFSQVTEIVIFKNFYLLIITFLKIEVYWHMQHYITFRYTTKWLDICVYCKMVTTVSLINIILKVIIIVNLLYIGEFS